jgi:hypothetical protein
LIYHHRTIDDAVLEAVVAQCCTCAAISLWNSARRYCATTVVEALMVSIVPLADGKSQSVVPATAGADSVIAPLVSPLK